jgi:hypothetical protein
MLIHFSGLRSGTRDRCAEVRDNLTARISEAEREGWLGEIEVSSDRTWVRVP